MSEQAENGEEIQRRPFIVSSFYLPHPDSPGRGCEISRRRISGYDYRDREARIKSVASSKRTITICDPVHMLWGLKELFPELEVSFVEPECDTILPLAGRGE